MKTEKYDYIHPGSAKESSLIGHIFEQKMTEEEELLIIEWIDIGAFWNLSTLKMHDSQKN